MLKVVLSFLVTIHKSTETDNTYHLHKINLEDIPYSRFFESNENLATRGHALKSKTKSCKEEIGRNFISVSVISP